MAWKVASCSVLLQLLTTHGFSVWSTHVPLAHRHVQFDFVQLLPLTSATHESAQSVTSAKLAATRGRAMVRVEITRAVVRITAR